MSNDLSGSATPSNDSVVTSNEQKDSVSYETHKRLLEQRKKDQSVMQDLQSKLQQFEEATKRVEEEKLMQQGELKKILDLREKELNEYKSKHADLKKAVVDDYKLRSFEKALPGKIKNEKYLNFVPKDKIAINPESGEIDEDSLKSVIAEFMEEHGESLIVRQEAGRLPGALPRIGVQISKPVSQMTKNEKIDELKKHIAAIAPSLKQH